MLEGQRWTRAQAGTRSRGATRTRGPPGARDQVRKKSEKYFKKILFVMKSNNENYFILFFLFPFS